MDITALSCRQGTLRYEISLATGRGHVQQGTAMYAIVLFGRFS